jgi:hypothetical protein
MFALFSEGRKPASRATATLIRQSLAARGLMYPVTRFVPLFPQCTQASQGSPGARLNSRTLFVTSTQPQACTWS